MSVILITIVVAISGRIVMNKGSFGSCVQIMVKDNVKILNKSYLCCESNSAVLFLHYRDDDVGTENELTCFIKTSCFS